MPHRKPKNYKDYPEISVKPGEVDGQLDFVKLFGRNAPVHIEIGSGKGTFLINEAKAHPELNFLGIEWANKYYRYAVDRLGRQGLKNVRIIRTNAANLVAMSIPPCSVSCFHIYFPDPWPKRRHNKRRLICPDNLRHLLCCLTDGGTIRICTDHPDYFRWIKQATASESDRLQEVEFTTTPGVAPAELVGTNFERKYIRQNRPIYAVALKYCPTSRNIKNIAMININRTINV